jgi:hypothetical protein
MRRFDKAIIVSAMVATAVAITYAEEGAGGRKGGGPAPAKDVTAESDIYIYPWYGAGTSSKAAERWRAVYTYGQLYGEPYDLQGPYEDRNMVGEIKEGTATEAVDGRSILTASTDRFDEVGLLYEAWVKLRADGAEGWLWTGNATVGEPLVRFTKPFSPLREGPSAASPAIRAEENTWASEGWTLTRNVAAGQIYEVVTSCGDWVCLGRRMQGVGAWLPADTPGLEFYYLTFSWAADVNLYFSFYFPARGDVGRIVYCAEWDPSPHSRDFGYGEDAALALTADAGVVDSSIKEVGGYGGFEAGIVFYEAVLPRPVKRDDITSITFTLGEKDEKFKFTVDPREAWRKGGKK